ncbi:hypothetical protein ACVWZ4_001161 [Bradyrhizobium sp. USDA 4472]
MTSQWEYQLRFGMSDSAVAEAIRLRLQEPKLGPLFDTLISHRAAPKCLFDTFTAYLATAERYGIERYPLYEWTKAMIEIPTKQEEYLKNFAAYVDDCEVFAEATADALETALQSLVGCGLIARMIKHNTNPANNPQPPEWRAMTEPGDESTFARRHRSNLRNALAGQPDNVSNTALAKSTSS